jgi:hypothetical protein
MNEMLNVSPSFRQMDDYPYATLRADGCLHCDGLHRPDFPILLRDVLHHFGDTGTLTYCGHMYHEFGRGRCEVHVNIPTHPSDPSLMAWFTMAIGDDLDDTLERASHRAVIEYYERHLSGLNSTVVALFPIWDMGNREWSEHLAATCDPVLATYHMGWAFMMRYAQHVNSML